MEVKRVARCSQRKEVAMKLRTVFFILFLLFLTVFLGWGKYIFLPKYLADTFPPILLPTPSPVVNTSSDPTLSVLAALSTREKIAQLIAVPVTVSGSSLNADVKSFLASHSVGVVTLFGENISTVSATKTLAEIYAVASSSSEFHDLQPLIAVDHEGGTVQRLKGAGFTKLPSWNEWCEKPSSDRNVLQKSARELRNIGIDIVFAPVVDVATQSTPLRSRVCSNNASVTLEQAQKWIDTFSAQGITSVIKHYPGIGDVSVDLHQKFAIIPVSKSQENIFHTLLEKNPQVSIMSTHAGVVGVSSGPCSLNKQCLERLNLKDEQLLFTDGLEMVAALYSEQGEQKAISQAAVEAIEAGNSVLVFGKSTSLKVIEEVLNTLEVKYTSSPEFQQKVDQNVLKILSKKLKGKTP